VVDDERVDEGVTEKVLFELEADEFEDICTHVLKLSEETCRDPEHEVFEVFVVIVDLSIASEKVTDTVTFRPDEELSAGLVETTVGAVVSVESSSLVSSSLESSSLVLLFESSSA